MSNSAEMKICKECKNGYELTKDNFYTFNGKFKTTYCKKCSNYKSNLRVKEKQYWKNKPYVNRNDYFKNRRKKIKHQKFCEKLSNLILARIAKENEEYQKTLTTNT